MLSSLRGKTMNRNGTDDTTSVQQLQAGVNDTFVRHFGKTPLQERIDDIARESVELRRYTDVLSMREELGDLLASSIQLANENGWSIAELLEENRKKIECRSTQYQSLGRKYRVCILGGAFDPITKGHIQVAKFILDSSGEFDQVWLMPCNQHMFSKTMVSAQHRLEMCRIASYADKRIKVSDYEVRNCLSGETYAVAKRLLGDPEYKDTHNFSMAIGMDNALSFDKWVNYTLLERLMRFVVVPRKGYSLEQGSRWFLREPHIFLCDNAPSCDVSSTAVRSAIKQGRSIETMVTSKVIEYMCQNGIYEQYLSRKD